MDPTSYTQPTGSRRVKRVNGKCCVGLLVLDASVSLEAIQAHEAQERCPWLDGAPWSLEEKKARHMARSAHGQVCSAGPMSLDRDMTSRSTT